jgi:alkylation response protein AidB-like acyl-CoA dehydrogenase
LTALRSEAGDAWLARIADSARVAVAGIEPQPLGVVRATQTKQSWRLSGQSRIVLDAWDADALIVVAEDIASDPHLFLVEPNAKGVAKRAVPTLDGRMAADLTFDDVDAGAPLPGDSASMLALTRDEALACICLEAAGLMRRLVRDTVVYVKQREQFGQPLGGFQVVQHRLVDMNIQARRAGAIARRAMASLDADEITRQRATSAAKVTICKAGRFVGQSAVQLHGGMGMTVELAIGRCFKRLTAIESQLGSADYHLRRFQRLRALSN